MNHEGPLLESLTRRLAETPEDFLAEPQVEGRGRVQTSAVVGDLLRLLGSSATPEQLAAFVSKSAPLRTSDLPEDAEANPSAFAQARGERNQMAVALILCWLLSDDWFRQLNPGAQVVLDLLRQYAAQLSLQQASRKFVNDPDRREEMARLILAKLGFRPAGETLAQAQDRLSTLNSAERARVMKAARAAEERARQIREALVRKAAEESADKWTRE
jgi:hypothetical protein